MYNNRFGYNNRPQGNNINNRYQNVEDSQSKNSLVLPKIGTNRSSNLRRNRTDYDDNESNYNRFENLYQSCNVARSMVQTRLDKLKYERELMMNMRGSYAPYNRDLSSLYNIRALSNARGQMGNPNLYSYQFMDPIYYPLEMPINGEPVALPRIEMGGPVGLEEPKGGLGIGDILTLLNALGKINQQPVQVVQPPIVKVEEEPEKKKKASTPSTKSEGPKKVPIIPDNKKNEGINRGIKRDWWKLAANFVNLYCFFSTAKKYAKQGKVRNSLIAQRTKAIVQDISVLKDWIIAIEEPFWNEFKVFQDLNVAFKNIDSKIKIQKESQKIIAMIKKYMENLIAKSSKLADIPTRIQTIIYEYLREKAYYPKKYLSTFQINRIDFHFYGGAKNLTDSQLGMIVAYLIICGVTVQQILLHMRDIFLEFKSYPNIDITAKYIGSIMHYLTRDTFQNDPVMLKELIALINYYRNYHLFNEQVEKQQDIFNSNMVFLDEDEFAEFLIPEGQINQFWNLNGAFVETYKNFIYAWACKLGKLIKLKYQKSDPNLIPKKKMERPQDKTVEYDIQIGNKV